ncbi:MAG: copper-binding protein [Candidatus Nitrotoga sp.]
MKLHITSTLIAGLFATNIAIAQHAGMEGMKGMEGKKSESQDTGGGKINHQTTGIVKATDAKKGTVLLAHEAVPSLSWPAMTMEFRVENPALFNKLINGNKVTVEFMQQGKVSVITSVR